MKNADVNEVTWRICMYLVCTAKLSSLQQFTILLVDHKIFFVAYQ